MKVALIPTGIANIASVTRGLERAGAEVEPVTQAKQVDDAAALVLPGVGSFHAALEVLDPLRDSIRRHVEADKPLLAVCLGFQLLGAESEEAVGVTGLGIHPGRFRRFAETVRCPHLGWNEVTAPKEARLLRSGHFFFAHSYCLDEVPDGWTGATATHDDTFVAAMEKGSILATQFHPELSGGLGQQLLRAWVREAARC